MTHLFHRLLFQMKSLVRIFILSFIVILSLLPLRCLFIISNLISWIILKQFDDKKQIIRIRRNLCRCFPEKDAKEIRRLQLLVIRSTIDFFFFFLKSPYYSEHKIKKRCIFKNLDLIEDAFKTHKFVICYSGHLVNYEMLVSFPLHFEQYGMCHLYYAKRMKKNILIRLLMKIRSRYGAINVPSNSPLRMLVKLEKELNEGTSLKKGYVFGTLADMDTTEQYPHASSFFHRFLEVKTGSERIGRKMNMKFLFANITRPKRGYYEIEFIEMNPSDVDTNIFAYTDEFVRCLENNLKLQPELWLQWGSPRF